MTVAEALSLIITFAIFVIALITLVVHIIKMNNKKDYPTPSESLG